MHGTAWKFGDNINTDEIIPARYLNTSDDAELGRHCMEDADPQFVEKISRGDIIVGGSNFGCGSSREHAGRAIIAAGVSCVVAESFARIFFRNAINIGLPIVECPEAAREAETGDVLSVDIETGEVVNETKGKTYSFPPFAPEMKEIVEAGGLMKFVAKKV
jgi:3-isopropylmalate/(R)-2-methylmalate dehydratase small subunit